MVPDAKAKSELFPCLLQLVNDDQQMKELKENISKLGNENADEVVATEILNKINKK